MLKNHLYPKTIEEVFEYLGKPNSKLLAGGTGLSLEKNLKLETLIDLNNVNLSYIKDEGEYFTIGAMTSSHEIYKYEDLPGSLKYAAYSVGDTPIMHAVTIGGNLAKFYNWVDLPPMLWALDSSIVIYNPNENVMSSDEFFAYSKQNNISARRELITEVRVPKPKENSYAEYQSFVTTENEKAQLSLASYFEWNEGKISNSRFVLSAAVGFPSRIAVIENKLNGSMLSDIDIDELVTMALDEVKLVSSYKSSVEYREQILGVYIKRTIKGLKNKMEAST
jgi:CO/xanthine dehydrogenase FAD-binding subunit